MFRRTAIDKPKVQQDCDLPQKKYKFKKGYTTQLILIGAYKCILKAGIPEELAADETVRRVYLGKDFELKKKKFQRFSSFILVITESKTYNKIAIGIAKYFKRINNTTIEIRNRNFILLSFHEQFLNFNENKGISTFIKILSKIVSAINNHLFNINSVIE